MVGYSPGNFSHAVSNSRDFALRNVAIELLRPQQDIRNRCEQVVRDQPKENCDIPEPSAATPATHVPLFETDELLVEAWHITGRVTTPPWDDRADVLLASLSGVSVTAFGGIDSANALKGGLLWLPAGSKPVFKTGPASDGHFIAITFKDSGSHSGPLSSERLLSPPQRYKRPCFISRLPTIPVKLSCIMCWIIPGRRLFRITASMPNSAP